ncbi:MAG: methylenetetrahydrofolate reductase [NAD(P)H] [Planctomycetaceae bacterium]|nr:methylenetetrahydrofolate reductase [NAD(P)H] [Planctomycetaceae bacterium]
MRLPEIFSTRKFAVSIEIFPPKTSDGDDALRRHMRTLLEYSPDFMSCTYGAGGSTRDRTIQWCQEIQSDFQRTAMAHFTCVGSTEQELNDWLDQASAAGIQNIMALRGDPPQGQENFQAVEGGLKNANELVELIRRHSGNFGVGVAGYPEKHIEASSMEVDLQNLKRKVDAGADVIFTQLFFDNQNFFRFRDQCDERGIRIPIVPGIMPITDYDRIKRITSMCGTVFPDALAEKLHAVKDDADAQFSIGVDYAIEQCRQLQDEDVPGIHFYALNKSQACQKILAALQGSAA